MMKKCFCIWKTSNGVNGYMIKVCIFTIPQLFQPPILAVNQQARNLIFPIHFYCSVISMVYSITTQNIIPKRLGLFDYFSSSDVEYEASFIKRRTIMQKRMHTIM